MRHATPSVNLAFSPWQLAVVVVVHAGVATALVGGDARALPAETAPLHVRMIAPEPLTAATAPAPAVRTPAPVPRVPPKPRAPRAPEPPLLATANSAPGATSPAAVEPAPPVNIAASAGKPEMVAAAAAPPPPAVSGPRFDADYLENPAPVYPAASRRLREQGKVVLRVFVEPDGHPAQIEVRTGSGSPRLDDAALDAVRRWRFVPARRGQDAVGAWVLVPIDFQLKG